MCPRHKIFEEKTVQTLSADQAPPLIPLQAPLAFPGFPVFDAGAYAPCGPGNDTKFPFTGKGVHRGIKEIRHFQSTFFKDSAAEKIFSVPCRKVDFKGVFPLFHRNEKGVIFGRKQIIKSALPLS